MYPWILSIISKHTINLKNDPEEQRENGSDNLCRVCKMATGANSVAPVSNTPSPHHDRKNSSLIPSMESS